MLNKIIDFALHNRLIVMVASALLIFMGSYTASNMEVDVFPDLTAPTVVILTEAHGMAPEEAERLVTYPIETAVNGASNVRRVRSSSSAGISIVWVEFNWGTDIYQARQIVNERMISVAENLPAGVGNPTLAPNSSIMGEIMLISLTADSTSLMDLRTIADWNIRPRLLATGGVSQVVVIGGEYKQYQLLASPQKMKYYGVSLPELLKASEEANQNASGGFLNEYGNEYIVRGIGKTSDLAELGKSVIKTVDQVPVKIEDVAELKIGPSVKIGDGSLKGKPAVIMTVMKQPNTNTLELTEKIDAAMAEMGQNLPQDIHINTRIFRQADFITASVNNIQKVLVEGSIFVVIILFIFLMNWRATVISLIAIPISILVAILTLKWLGLTINTMSLGGMAIAVGDLVDDAIIDVENVYRRLKENAHKPLAERVNKLKVIYHASVEIRSSVINATFIIIVAFVPLFFLSGMEGRLLAPLGIAFIVALFASLIVAITLTPVLCSFLLTSDKMLLKEHQETWLVRHLNAGYEKALVKAMTMRKLVIGLAVGLLAVALFLFSGLGRSFLPEFNEGSLVVSVVSLPGISLEESNKIGNQVEQALLTIPEIKITTRRTGRAESDEHAQGVNASEIDAPFTLDERDREEFMKEVREKVGNITTANITIGQPIGHRIDHMLSGTRANIAIKIFGTDLSQLFTLSNQVKTSIEGIEGLVDLSVEQQVGIPQIQIKAKRDMLAKYGISIGQFTEFIDVAFAGEKVSEVYEGARSFDLILKFDDANRGKIENIRNALIDARNGEKIPLHYVADIVSTSGPNTINRENVQRKTVVSANVAGRDQKSAVAEIRQKIEANIKLPEGYHIEYGGQFEAEAEASRTLMIASVLALLVIFLLLYQEFKDAKVSGIILLNLPLALIGGILSIYFTSGILSIPAIIGFITLFGIATRNGILLVSHYELLLRENNFTGTKNEVLYHAIIQGSKDRLSPILMTALTAALALIPLAIAGDLPGNEIQSPMAKVILGGLLTSAVLNLFVIPIVFFWTNYKKGNGMKSIRKTVRMNIWKGLFFSLIILFPSAGFAQNNLEAVLQSVAQNNKAILANKQYWEARKLAFRTGLTPENPEVVYDYMRGRPQEIAGNQQDLAVIQQFDFPTAYGKKKALSKEQIAQTEFQATAYRQDILLEAKLHYLEMVYLNRQKVTLARRLKTSEKLYYDYQKKFKQGFANVLEVNKTKIQLAALQNEVRRNESDLRLFTEKLTQLNGGNVIAITDTLYPVLPQIPAYAEMDSLVEVNDPILKTVKQQKEIAVKEKEVTKALTLPRPSVGYHSQAILGQQFNGGRVGVTIPLWQDKNKVKQKEAEILYSELQIQNHRTEHLHDIKAFYNRYESLRTSLADYQNLMQTVNSDVLLVKAFRLGEISSIEYFMELTYFYNAYDNYLTLEKEYNQVVAELYKFSL